MCYLPVSRDTVKKQPTRSSNLAERKNVIEREDNTGSGKTFLAKVPKMPFSIHSSTLGDAKIPLVVSSPRSALK